LFINRLVAKLISKGAGMKKILTSIIVLSVLPGMLVLSANLLGGTPYNVFCAEGTIEVDTRTLDEMKSARGSNTCIKGTFDYLSDADKLAESLGGKGASCSCN
jgi:hypothetical protein